jgi:hypothetical protein
MASHHKIKGRDVLNDIRSGMTAAELMAKYEMSSQVLDTALEQLVTAGVISRDEVRRWLSESTRTLLDRGRRRKPKHHLESSIRVFDKNHSDVSGVIRDITEEGVGIKGIQARLDQVKILEVVPDESTGLDAFAFQAKCRWIKQGSDGQYVGGFQIIHISEQGLDMLRKLIAELTSRD